MRQLRRECPDHSLARGEKRFGRAVRIKIDYSRSCDSSGQKTEQGVLNGPRTPMPDIRNQTRLVGYEASRVRMLGGLETSITEQWRVPELNVAWVQGLL